MMEASPLFLWLAFIVTNVCGGVGGWLLGSTLRDKFKCDHVAGPVVESRYGLTRTQRCIKCGRKAKVQHFDPNVSWATLPPPPPPPKL